MKADALLTATIKVKAPRDEDVFIRTKERWQVYLFASAAAAAVTATFGLALSAASLLGAISSSGTLSTAGSVLLVISFSLLVVTAHCLDRIDEMKTAIRVASYRKSLVERITR